MNVSQARILAEVLRVQQWAGSQYTPSAARIYGLMHGFESALEYEHDEPGISREQEKAVLDWLDTLRDGEVPQTGMDVKWAMSERGIDERVASRVMELSLLRDRYGDVIKRLRDVPGSPLDLVGDREGDSPNHWLGAIHFIELIAGEERRAVFSPNVPRVGEIVEPDQGTPYVVEQVVYRASIDGEEDATRRTVLIPHVILTPAGDDDNA